MTVLLVVLALAFAWSMGAHYTGACMGMPHALKVVSTWQALVIMAPLAWLGAALASHGVEHTVAERLTARPLGVPAEVLVVGVAFALTTSFTRLKIPTSTIQILVFSVAGAALGVNIAVTWSTIAILALVWVTAPVVAAAAGFGLTRLFDSFATGRSSVIRSGAVQAGPAWGGGAVQAGAASSSTAPGAGTRRQRAGPVVAAALVIVGGAASFAMGGNDVANATGSLVATHTMSPLIAGVAGGGGLALGVLTWGRRLLRRMAFEIVMVDRSMATAAQAVQAAVVIAAVSFGVFTSMNQALIGAMAGAGAARGRETVNGRVLAGIVRGWLIGPAAGLAGAYLGALLVTTLGGRGTLG